MIEKEKNIQNMLDFWIQDFTSKVWIFVQSLQHDRPQAVVHPGKMITWLHVPSA